MSKIVPIVPNSKKSLMKFDKHELAMFSEAIKNGMATRKMVEKRLDQQLLNMQVVREENLIIAKREQGEDKEYELTSKEIIDIESECLKSAAFIMTRSSSAIVMKEMRNVVKEWKWRVSTCIA